MDSLRPAIEVAREVFKAAHTSPMSEAAALLEADRRALVDAIVAMLREGACAIAPPETEGDDPLWVAYSYMNAAALLIAQRFGGTQ